MVKPSLLPLVACAFWACGGEDPVAPPGVDAGALPPPSQPLPTQVAFDIGDARLVVDAAHGARITELSLAGKNVLSGPEINAQNYGSTFWPSPQSLWNWPPLWQFDTGQYTGGLDSASGTLRLASEAAPLPLAEGFPKLRITKTFAPLPGQGAVDVTYTLANASTNGEPAVTTAPWQVTRVRGTGGLTFFAKGPGPVRAAAQLPLIEQAGLLWFPFAPASVDAKTFADARGWVAHVTAERLLLVLRFEDIQPADSPEGDAELELYTGPGSPKGNYLEIEPLGKKKTLAAGDSLTWTVRFLLRALPADITPAVGDPALIAYVDSVR